MRGSSGAAFTATGGSVAACTALHCLLVTKGLMSPQPLIATGKPHQPLTHDGRRHVLIRQIVLHLTRVCGCWQRWFGGGVGF